MDMFASKKYTIDDISEIFKEKADAVIIIYAEQDFYTSVSLKGIFTELLEDS